MSSWSVSGLAPNRATVPKKLFQCLYLILNSISQLNTKSNKIMSGVLAPEGVNMIIIERYFLSILHKTYAVDVHLNCNVTFFGE